MSPVKDCQLWHRCTLLVPSSPAKKSHTRGGFYAVRSSPLAAPPASRGQIGSAALLEPSFRLRFRLLHLGIALGIFLDYLAHLAATGLHGLCSFACDSLQHAVGAYCQRRSASLSVRASQTCFTDADLPILLRTTRSQCLRTLTVSAAFCATSCTVPSTPLPLILRERWSALQSF